ncbi:hypothetical protein AX17_005173 [Amanita inopinata Kibby_2008]|nr:hypothetical protein AX17_005173 [Amanita inopinata Kibby_2008]
MAEVLFDTVYKLHGLPEKIISNRDSLFTSIFWGWLHELMNVELRLSSAYHPQTNGATERANRTMTQMLQQCVSPDQKDWAEWLPAIEFALNCTWSKTTGFSPFFLNYTRQLHMMIWGNRSDFPGVTQFAMQLKQALMRAHDAIIEAWICQTDQANKHRHPADFKEGDLVYLSTKNLRLPKGRARKLVPKYIGPFRILWVASPGSSYQLELSAELKKWGLHNMFHTSLLRQHFPNDDRRFPGRQIHQLPGFNENPREWNIEQILTHSGCRNNAIFQVQWSTGDVTWAPYAEMKNLTVLDEYFEVMGVTHPRELANNMDGPPLGLMASSLEYKTSGMTNLQMSLGQCPRRFKGRDSGNSDSPPHILRSLPSNMPSYYLHPPRYPKYPDRYRSDERRDHHDIVMSDRAFDAMLDHQRSMMMMVTSMMRRTVFDTQKPQYGHHPLNYTPSLHDWMTGCSGGQGHPNVALRGCNGHGHHHFSNQNRNRAPGGQGTSQMNDAQRNELGTHDATDNTQGATDGWMNVDESPATDPWDAENDNGPHIIQM